MAGCSWPTGSPPPAPVPAARSDYPARIGGQLSVRGATLTNLGTGPALHGGRLRAEDSLLLEPVTLSVPAGQVTVTLRSACVGRISLHPSDYNSTTRLAIDGLTYQGRPPGTADDWRRLRREATPHPYQYLADQYLAEGLPGRLPEHSHRPAG